MLIATAIIKDKNELDKCISNLIDEKDITISFRNEDVFVDKVDDVRSDVLLQKVKDVSSFTPEDKKYSNGISMIMNPVHLKHSLDVFDENEPFGIYIYESVCKLVQRNYSFSSPIMGLSKLDDVIYHTKKMEDKMDSESLTSTSVLKVHMKDVAHIFKKISDAENNARAYERLYPFYTLKFDKKYSSFGKGDVDSHFLSIQLTEFDFSGEPVKVQVSDKIEKARGMFNPDKIVTIKCHTKSIIHFSQDYSSTMKIDFLIGVMSR